MRFTYTFAALSGNCRVLVAGIPEIMDGMLRFEPLLDLVLLGSGVLTARA